MLIMKKILSVVGITGGTFFLLVAAICVEEWFSDPAYAADMEISGLIMCIVLGIFGVILIVLGIQTLRLQKLYREYKEIAEASNDGFIPDMAAILNQPEDKVRRNLEKLCKKKYFNDAYVDNKAKLFVRKDQMNQKIGNPSFTKTVKQTDAELITVKCKGCGGINVGECEIHCGNIIHDRSFSRMPVSPQYCGSPITGIDVIHYMRGIIKERHIVEHIIHDRSFKVKL